MKKFFKRMENLAENLQNNKKISLTEKEEAQMADLFLRQDYVLNKVLLSVVNQRRYARLCLNGEDDEFIKGVMQGAIKTCETIAAEMFDLDTPEEIKAFFQDCEDLREKMGEND